MYRCDFTIYDMIVRNADLYPEKSAIIYGEKRISFRNYLSLCDKFAEELRKAGIEVGERIAVLSSNSDDFMIICGAAAKIGAIVVPLNYRLSEEELRYILNDSATKQIYSSKDYKDLAKKVSADVPSIEKHLVFKSGYNDSEHLQGNKLSQDVNTTKSSTVSSSNAFMIIYTAAVGGKPRGCVLSQMNMLAAGIQMAQMLDLSSSDCNVTTLPLFHIGGFSMALAVMHQGGKNVIMGRYNPLDVLKLVETEKGTFFGTFPPMLAGLLDAQESESFDLSSLRGVGGIDSPETIRRFLALNPKCAFFSLYGQTEAMPVSGCNIADKPGSIGLPAIMTRVAIFNDLDQQVDIGVQGEICVRSPSVFIGYWKLDLDTKQSFRNGWHHTGDLGRIDEDGFIWYAGRKAEKELIKPGGENVYPAEVENTILSHDAINEVCVIGVPDAEWGEAVIAICVRKAGEKISEAELIEYVSSKIARYKKPKRVYFVENLPKRANGEIDRDQVKKTYSDKNLQK